MAEPLHLPPEQEPETEQIKLGDQVLELDPESARIVRDQFEAMAAQYGAALEEYRRQALQSIGTPRGPYPDAMPPVQESLAVPDPDLLFQNKQAWTDDFARSLEGRLGQLEGRQTQLVQGAVSAFQQELQRRDAAQAAQARHDAAMAEMLERRQLNDEASRTVVQAVYNQEYDKLKHLPLELGLDKIGVRAQEVIGQIRAGETWTMGPAATQTGVAPRPPAMLRSARRASRAPAAAAPPDRPLEAPGGGIGAMGTIIRKHQAARMRLETA